MQIKERLYIADFVQDSVVAYPSYYLLSRSMSANELLRETLGALHRLDFASYRNPLQSSEIFHFLHSGSFPIFKERYAVGYFGGRIMYLESSGWKSMPMSQEAFEMQNWLLF